MVAFEDPFLGSILNLMGLIASNRQPKAIWIDRSMWIPARGPVWVFLRSP